MLAANLDPDLAPVAPEQPRPKPVRERPVRVANDDYVAQGEELCALVRGVTWIDDKAAREIQDAVRGALVRSGAVVRREGE